MVMLVKIVPYDGDLECRGRSGHPKEVQDDGFGIR